jgi:drug/metabolite transporter superfamily protein YnfA
MNFLARALFVLLALTSIDASAQKPVSDEASRLRQDYAFDKSVAGAAPTAIATEDENKRFHEYRMQQQRDKLNFAILLGAVALVAHLIVLGFLYRQAPGHIVGATGLVYIVFGTILLVVIANTEAQLTAAIGVLGAVAGYLFGRLQQERGHEGENGTNPQPAAPAVAPTRSAIGPPAEP